ncbi:hypothetical protein D9619_010022 [Psilocybe cf. subviscida]|uniref:F-box domain-containing protein n=1 Tax=Psilocybe cf. subviscida TaxID=2480587 RepID=A0A8H5BL26_9AGAR|nr:hypothetical protein D9619_010022 [Psilocybe cf. subviscida]
MATQISYHEAQMLIDKEIADLTARIRLLKTRRNVLARVSQLPDEILQHIFLILRDLHSRYSNQWQSVTHICRYWRRVAIGLPSLWTRLYDPPHDFGRLMLKRSQNAPLEVGLETLEQKHSITILTSILREINHIRTLEFNHMPCNFLDTVHDILTGLDPDSEASLLESLIIGTASVPRPASIRVITDIFRPTHLLRRLSLLEGYFDWGMFPLPSLTHLELHSESLGGVSGTHFMETLRHMQNLETLKMRWSTMNIGQFPPSLRPQPIQLTCLRRLEIWDGSQVALESFLSLVMHPRLHQLDINPTPPVANTLTFTKSILSSVGRANFGPLEFLRIEHQGVTLSPSPETDILHHDEWSSFIHSWIPKDVHHDCGTPFTSVADIISWLSPLHSPNRINLRHICLDSSDAPIGDFTRLFASLPHLEIIEVYRELALVLFKAMNITSTSDSAVPTTPTPFPKLQTIIWHDHFCRLHDHDDIWSDRPLLSSSAFSDLYSGLLFRYAHGASIPKLELAFSVRPCPLPANGMGTVDSFTPLAHPTTLSAPWLMPMMTRPSPSHSHTYNILTRCNTTLVKTYEDGTRHQSRRRQFRSTPRPASARNQSPSCLLLPVAAIWQWPKAHPSPGPFTITARSHHLEYSTEHQHQVAIHIRATSISPAMSMSTDVDEEITWGYAAPNAEDAPHFPHITVSIDETRPDSF